MRTHFVAALAAALLAGSSTVVLAQSNMQGGQGNQGSGMNQNDGQTQYNRTWPPGPLSPQAEGQNNSSQLQGQSRASQRSLLRQELRQAGFQNIRILDATFLVQATAGSGQQVLMVVNPPDPASMTTSSSSASDQTFGNQGQSNERQQLGSSQNFRTAASQNPLADEITTPGLVGQDRIRSHLQSRGFSNISDLTQDGNTYIGMADWYGEQVDFRVDGRNGFVIEPSHLNPSQVRTMLTSEGWDSVGNIQQQGTSYRVQASRNGTSYNLWVDARTGEVNRQMAGTGGSSGNQNSGAQQ